MEKIELDGREYFCYTYEEISYEKHTSMLDVVDKWRQRAKSERLSGFFLGCLAGHAATMIVVLLIIFV